MCFSFISAVASGGEGLLRSRATDHDQHRGYDDDDYEKEPVEKEGKKVWLN